MRRHLQGCRSSGRSTRAFRIMSERRHDVETMRATDAAGARAPRASRTSPRTDLRHIVDPADIAQAHALAARLARVMRARLVRRERVRRRGRRLDLRRTIHRNVSHGGTPDRPRLAEAQDQAAAAGHAARCVRLDEPLHGVLRALPARRGRCVPRSRSLRVPHAARACVARRCATAT